VNLLYYGDNLDILRGHIKNETIDLVYLDPPFKSNQDYNVLFAEQNGSRSKAQLALERMTDEELLAELERPNEMERLTRKVLPPGPDGMS
jgi:16S rRNA G966 N2-methylase RsmD